MRVLSPVPVRKRSRFLAHLAVVSVWMVSVIMVLTKHGRNKKGSFDKIRKIRESDQNPPREYFARSSERAEINIDYTIYGSTENTPTIPELLQTTLKNLENEDFRKTTSQIKHYETKQSNHRIITPDSIFTVNSPKCSTFSLQIYVKSHHDLGEKRRNHIRATWGLRKSVIFVMTTESEDESKVYKNDELVVLGYPESSDNLSIKVLVILKHAEKCGNNFVLLTDDDVHFWVDDLEIYLTTNSNYQESTITGHVNWASTPVRKKNLGNGKYFISPSEYPFSIFPPFCPGMGYVIKKPAVSKLYQTSFTVPFMRHLDDVFVGLLAYFSNVTFVNDVRFSSSSESEYFRCDTFNVHRRIVDEEFERARGNCGKGENDVFRDPRGSKFRFTIL